MQQLEFGCKGEADNDLGVRPAIASWLRSPHLWYYIPLSTSPDPLAYIKQLTFRWKGLALKLLRLGGQWCGCEAGHCQLTEGKASLRRLLAGGGCPDTCSPLPPPPHQTYSQDCKLSHYVTSTHLLHLQLVPFLCLLTRQQMPTNEFDFMAWGCYLLAYLPMGRC